MFLNQGGECSMREKGRLCIYRDLVVKHWGMRQLERNVCRWENFVKMGVK